jgi:hypothetical protein
MSNSTEAREAHRLALRGLRRLVLQDKRLPLTEAALEPPPEQVLAFGLRLELVQAQAERLGEVRVALGKGLALAAANLGRAWEHQGQIHLVANALMAHVERLVAVGQRLLALSDDTWVDPMGLDTRLSPWWNLRSPHSSRLVGAVQPPAGLDANYTDPATLQYLRIQTRILCELERSLLVGLLDDVVRMIGGPVRVQGTDVAERVRCLEARRRLGTDVSAQHLEPLRQEWLAQLSPATARHPERPRAAHKAERWFGADATRFRGWLRIRQHDVLRALKSAARRVDRDAAHLQARLGGLQRRLSALPPDPAAQP